MPQRPSLYVQVVTITQLYLGGAAERFINRQIQNHLLKDPIELSQSDLRKLITWLKAAMSMLTEDSHVIEEYIAKLEHLTHNDTPSERKQHAAR